MGRCGWFWIVWVVLGSLWVAVDRFGSFWIVLGHFGSFSVVPHFSNCQIISQIQRNLPHNKRTPVSLPNVPSHI